jgi:hypothetical protein
MGSYTTRSDSSSNTLLMHTTDLKTGTTVHNKNWDIYDGVSLALTRRGVGAVVTSTTVALSTVTVYKQNSAQ